VNLKEVTTIDWGQNESRQGASIYVDKDQNEKAGEIT
jgi:hypothetical protein